MANKLATGVTLTGATSGAVLEIISGPNFGASRGAVDTTHSTTTDNWTTRCPSELKTLKPFSVTVRLDPRNLGDPGDANYALNGLIEAVEETWTIQWPAASGETTGPSLAYQGWVEDYDVVEEPISETDTITATLRFQTSGKPDWTDAV